MDSKCLSCYNVYGYLNQGIFFRKEGRKWLSLVRVWLKGDPEVLYQTAEEITVMQRLYVNHEVNFAPKYCSENKQDKLQIFLGNRSVFLNC